MVTGAYSAGGCEVLCKPNFVAASESQNPSGRPCTEGCLPSSPQVCMRVRTRLRKASSCTWHVRVLCQDSSLLHQENSPWQVLLGCPGTAYRVGTDWKGNLRCPTHVYASKSPLLMASISCSVTLMISCFRAEDRDRWVRGGQSMCSAGLAVGRGQALWDPRGLAPRGV